MAPEAAILWGRAILATMVSLPCSFQCFGEEIAAVMNFQYDDRGRRRRLLVYLSAPAIKALLFDQGGRRRRRLSYSLCMW